MKNPPQPQPDGLTIRCNHKAKIPKEPVLDYNDLKRSWERQNKRK